jgi:hypothetical protein
LALGTAAVEAASSFQPVNANLTALSAAAGTANTFWYLSGSFTVSNASITAAGLALLDDANAAAQRTTLGLGSFATKVQTVSTSAASGTPADGDCWLQYTP